MKLNVIGNSNIFRNKALNGMLSAGCEVGMVASKNNVASSPNLRFSNDYFEALTDLDAQGVYISTPNSTHYELAKFALSSGKHVIVEKTMALEMEQVEELNAIASKNSLVLMETFQYRFHSQHNYFMGELDSWLSEGVVRIDVSFGIPPFDDPNNIRYNRALGGGALFDLGAYCANLVSEITKQSDRWELKYHRKVARQDLTNRGHGLFEVFENVPVFFNYGFENNYTNSVSVATKLRTTSFNRYFTAPADQTQKVNIRSNQSLEVINFSDDQFANMFRTFRNASSANGDPLRMSLYSKNVHQANILDKMNAG